MPGAMKRRTPINLNASPARLTAALSRHSIDPANFLSASVSGADTGTPRNEENESEDDEEDDDPLSDRPSLAHEQTSPRSMHTSNPPNPWGMFGQFQTTMTTSNTPFSPPSENAPSPAAHGHARRQSVDSIFTASGPSSPEMIFSPRNSVESTNANGVVTYQLSPRTPNRPEQRYQPLTLVQDFSRSSYPAPTPHAPPAHAFNSPSQELRVSRSGSASPMRNPFRTPIPPMHESVMHQMLSAILPVLDNHNQIALQRIDAMEGVVNNLIDRVKEVREDGKAQTSKFADVLKSGYAAQRGDTQRLEQRLDHIAQSFQQNALRETQSLNTRLDDLLATIGKVAESVNTMKSAGKLIQVETVNKVFKPPVASANEAGTSTAVAPKTFVEASTSYEVPEGVQEDEEMQPPSPEPVTRVDAATSPVMLHQYLDAAVEALPPGLDTEDIGVSTEWVGYVSTGTARTPSPEPMVVEVPQVERLDAATSPMRNQYIHSATMPRTPTPSPVRHTLGVMTLPEMMTPPPPRPRYTDIGTSARSPDPVAQRLSVGLMTSPSPQRFAASRRSPGSATTPADGLLNEIAPSSPSGFSQSTRSPSRSPSMHSRPHTRHATPEDMGMLTQRTDSMPGMVTPPVSSPAIDLRAYSKPATRFGPLQPAKLSFTLSQQVDWNRSFRDTRSLSTSLSQLSDPPGPAPLSQEQDAFIINRPDGDSHASISRPTSPSRIVSPPWRTPSPDEEVDSSVKEEHIYESIENAPSSEQPMESSINEFSNTEADVHHQASSSIGTFGESLVQESLEQQGQYHLSMETFEEEHEEQAPLEQQGQYHLSIQSPEPEQPQEEQPKDCSRAISIESSSPEPQPCSEEKKDIIEPAQAIPAEPENSPEPEMAQVQDASPLFTPEPQSDLDDNDEYQGPSTPALEPPQMESIVENARPIPVDENISQEQLEPPVYQPSSRIPSPYYPVSHLRSPVRGNQEDRSESLERAVTPENSLFDDDLPYSPARSEDSDQDGSELSVARLVMAAGSQSPEKLPTIPEAESFRLSPEPVPPVNAELTPEPEPMAEIEPDVPREVIDLSTPNPSFPSTPVRSGTGNEESLFKIRVPSSVHRSEAPSTPAKAVAPISIPPTPVVLASVSSLSQSRTAPSPIRVPDSRDSSPLSSPPPSDNEKRLGIFIDSDSDVEIIVKKRKADSTGITVKEEPVSKKKKILNIKAATLGQPSAAATRVKKRKVKPVDEWDEPPLKRARERSVLATANEDIKVKTEAKAIVVKQSPISASTTSSAKGKGKARESISSSSSQKKTSTSKPKASPRKSTSKSKPKAAKWPAFPKRGDDKGFFSQWIECIACENWYHRGCVGIKPNDPILGNQTSYVCPPCKATGGSGPRAVSTMPANLQKGQRYCARPDCQNQVADDNQYFVDCIIGRATIVSGGQGRRYKWLLRWDNYPDKEATWEEESAMEESHSLILDFYRKAEAEGFFPDQDTTTTMVLQASLEAGCPPYPPI